MEQDTNPPELIAEMHAPPARRFLAVAIFYVLGAFFIGLALFRPPAEIIWLVFLLVGGGASFWSAEKMRQSTAHGIRLTTEALWETGGRHIVSLEDIETVDRGMLAFKPSNGFLLTTKTKQERAWRPGLYWILGKKIGIGGVTSRGQAKLMADTITMTLIEQRTAAQEGDTDQES